jgi:hypothetical protein
MNKKLLIILPASLVLINAILISVYFIGRNRKSKYVEIEPAETVIDRIDARDRTKQDPQEQERAKVNFSSDYENIDIHLNEFKEVSHYFLSDTYKDVNVHISSEYIDHNVMKNITGHIYGSASYFGDRHKKSYEMKIYLPEETVSKEESASKIASILFLKGLKKMNRKELLVYEETDMEYIKVIEGLELEHNKYLIEIKKK